MEIFYIVVSKSSEERLLVVLPLISNFTILYDAFGFFTHRRSRAMLGNTAVSALEE